MVKGFVWSVGVVSILCLAGCGGGGGGGSTATVAVPYTGSTAPAEITVARAENVLDEVEQFVPGCTSSLSAARAVAGSSAVAPALVKAVAVVVRHLGTRQVARTAAATAIGDEVVGDCTVSQPGRILIQGTHDNGTDSVTMTFEEYCTQDGAEETTIGGNLAYVYQGTPSDSGPERDYFQVSSSGVTVTDDTQSTTVAFEGVRYTHNPNAAGPVVWSGGLPSPLATATVGNPDTLTVSGLRVRDELDPATPVTQLTSLAVDLEPTAASGLSVNVRTGQLYLPEDGYVSLSTPTPIVFASGTTTGALQLTGADDKVIRIEAAAGEPGVFQVTADGTLLPSDLDCSAMSVADDT